MLFRAARGVLTVALAFSVFTGTSPAKVVPARAAARHDTFLTPFDRYVRPTLDKLAAARQGKAVHAAMAAPVGNATSAIAPNFGGYLGATTYAARAANSALYDPQDNGMSAVLAADFNKDGHPDLAAVQDDGTLNILLNNGTGTMSSANGFLNPSPNVHTTGISQAFVTDLDGDGYPDVVAFDFNNSVVLAYHNNGDGTFTAQLTQLDTSSAYPQAIAVGDVNGDGKTDVVVGSFNGGSSVLTLQTLQGVGDGTYTALTAQNFTLSGPLALQGSTPFALGDLNGDGKLDIAILIDFQTGQRIGTYSLSTALGNGDGTFAAPGASIVSGSYLGDPGFDASSVQILDINNDGKLDIVFDYNNLLSVALGSGANSFQTPVTSPFESSGGTIYADMNGDGILDAITPGAAGVSIALGKGDGTFAAPALNGQYAANTTNQESAVLAVADFVGDKKPGVATLNIDEFQLSVFTGNGDGTLQGPVVQSLPADFNPSDLNLVGAFNANGDAYTDLIVADTNTAGLLYTGLSDGKGSFKYVQSVASLPADVDGSLNFQADFNGDGKQDLILVGAAGELWTALSNGDGTFATPVSINVPILGCPLGAGAAGDLNGDGKIDMVIAYPGDASCGGGSSNPSGYLVFKGNGDGTFQSPTLYPDGEQLTSATLADMNSDGLLDVILSDAPAIDPTGYNVTLELGNGDGSFGAPSTVLANNVVADIQVADMNQDGKLDLVIATQGLAGSDYSTAGIVIVNGNADGTFGQHNQIAIGNYFSRIQVADVNGDGIPDIEAALENYSGQQTTYNGFVTLLGLGGEGFSAPYNENTVAGAAQLLVGNFFNDNAPDVAVGNGGGVGIFLGQGGTTVAVAASSAAINIGAVETLTATVAATMSGRPIPSGGVAFYDGSTLLGTAAITSGSVTFSSSTLAVGTHSITAAYTGDENFNLNSTSAATSVTVATVAPAFTLAGTPSTLTLTQGANGTVILTLAANATFSGPVTLSCSGAPTNSTCGFDSSSVTLTAGGSTTATVVVGTTGTVSAANLPANPWENTGKMVSVAGIAAFLWIRRRRLPSLSVFGVVLLAVAAFGITGCGGGGTKTTTTPTAPSAPVVATGNYNLTVTATASGSAATAQTLQIAVTVQ